MAAGARCWSASRWEALQVLALAHIFFSENRHPLFRDMR
jgi:hypothetical protein